MKFFLEAVANFSLSCSLILSSNSECADRELLKTSKLSLLYFKVQSFNALYKVKSVDLFIINIAITFFSFQVCRYDIESSISREMSGDLKDGMISLGE